MKLLFWILETKTQNLFSLVNIIQVLFIALPYSLNLNFNTVYFVDKIIFNAICFDHCILKYFHLHLKEAEICD